MGTPNFMQMLPDFLQKLRMGNIFNQPMGNDLPEQGGFGGNMPQGTPPIFGGPSFVDNSGDDYDSDESGGGGKLQGMLSALSSQYGLQGLEGLGGPTSGAPIPQQMGPPSPAPQMQAPSPLGSMPPPMQPTPDIAVGGDRIVEMMKRLYQPQSEASDRFEQLQGEYPEYQKPNWLKVIGATLSDMVNPGTGMRVIEGNRPFKLADWKNKISPAQQSANLERQENVNARTQAFQTISQTLRAEADEARANKNEVDAKIRQQRADVYEFKARNPNLKLIPTKGGNVMAFNPLTKETSDTGIPTGSLTESDKMAMTQENALERIEATGGQQRETEKVRQTGRTEIAETRGWKLGKDEETGKSILYNEITGETKPVNAASGGNITPAPRPSASSGRPELPTQTKVREYNKARELLNTRPDLSKFLKLGPGTNEFRITQPGENFWGSKTGPTEDQVAEIETAIYGMPKSAIGQPTRTGALPTNTPSNVPSTNAATRVGKAPTLPKGAVVPAGEVAIAKDGKVIGTVRAENVEAAKAAGYQIVGQ